MTSCWNEQENHVEQVSPSFLSYFLESNGDDSIEESEDTTQASCYPEPDLGGRPGGRHKKEAYDHSLLAEGIFSSNMYLYKTLRVFQN